MSKKNTGEFSSNTPSDDLSDHYSSENDLNSRSPKSEMDKHSIKLKPLTYTDKKPTK